MFRRNSSAPIAVSVISTKGRNPLAWNCIPSEEDFSHPFEMVTRAELLRGFASRGSCLSFFCFDEEQNRHRLLPTAGLEKYIWSLFPSTKIVEKAPSAEASALRKRSTVSGVSLPV